ncbi:MAG TPA: PorV/PorQ family protein [Saprospiraceae bacterium]|nr:PorV/PorQ family protein [Saprospiraceae bacterium]
MFVHYLKAQNDIPLLSLEFLEINAQAQSKALGDVGVVAPNSNTHAALQQNPALLIQGSRKTDVNIKYMPWLRSRGLSYFFLEVGGSCSFSKRHAFGLNLKYLSDGLLKIPPSGFRSDYVVTMSYAYRLSKKWSVGTSYKLIRSDILSVGGTIGLNFRAFDFGVHHNYNKKFTGSRKLHFNWGAALTNLGPKVKFEKLYPNSKLSNYLPASLKTGALISIEKIKSKRYKRTRSFAYQIDKRLVPMASPDDLDNNGLPDYLEWKVGPSLFQSFVDSPDGLKGELAELVHKFGFEYKIEDQKYDFSLAFRLGYHHANAYLFNRKNVSAGFALSLRKIYFDLAYVTSLNLEQAVYENTFLFSVGTRQILDKKKD